MSQESLVVTSISLISHSVDSLSQALPNLKNLEQFSCIGAIHALARVVATLPDAVPHLKALDIRSILELYVHVHDADFVFTDMLDILETMRTFRLLLLVFNLFLSIQFQ
jgi:hypothetical protein